MKHRIIFAVLMSSMLSFFMSAWVTYINMGLHSEFVAHWLSAWILAWPAAGVIAFIGGPGVHRLSERLACARSRANS